MTALKSILYFVVPFFITTVGAQSVNGPADCPYLDNSIRYGKLPNGFTYFIKSISEPQSKLYLDFYNKVGKNQEDTDQLDFAHAVEHLAFKSTRNFPSGIRNSSALRSAGMGLYDLNGSSGSRSTQFNFDAPKGNVEALNTALLWFKDIASGLTLTEEDINQVRGELRQEFLGKLGDKLEAHSADGRLTGNFFPCRKGHFNYLNFQKNFQSESLRRFYKDWYRPDLLAISIVGNIINPSEIENKIIATFSDLEPLNNPRKLRDCYSEYYNRPPQFTVVERLRESAEENIDEAVKLNLIFRNKTLWEDLKSGQSGELIKMQLLIDFANKRLREATSEYLSFEAGAVDHYAYQELPPGMSLILTVFRRDTEKDALEKSINVLQQIRKFGIQESEWETIKQQHLQSLNLDDNNAIYWKKGIGNYYTYDEAFPAKKLEDSRQWLKKLTLEEFDDFTRGFLSAEPEDIGIIAPTGHKALHLKEREVRSWIDNVYREPTKPYEVPEFPLHLMDKEEVAALQTAGYKKVATGKKGIQEIVLNNGVRIIFNSQEAFSGEGPEKIWIHGFSLKGAGSFPEHKAASAILAPSIIKNSGANGMDKFELNQVLLKQGISPGALFTYIDYRESGIQAHVDVEKLESLLQLFYLNVTKPNIDEIAFEDWKRQEYNYYVNVTSDLIGMDFNNAIRFHSGDESIGTVLGKPILRGTERLSQIEDTQLKWAHQTYQSLFGNASDFTFLVSGNFDLERVLPLFQKYLGNLPNLKNLSDPVPSKTEAPLPLGPLVEVIRKPGTYQLKNKMYAVRFITEAEDPNDWQEKLLVQALGGIANHKAWALRFEKGYSLYNIGVAGSFNEEMERFEISSEFKCEPEEFEDIRMEVQRIVAELKTGKISEEEFKKGLQRFYIINTSERLGRPKTIRQGFYKHYRFGRPFIDPKEVESFVEAITIEDIVATAKKYLTDESLYEYVMEDE